MGNTVSSKQMLNWIIQSKETNFDVVYCRQKSLTAQRYLVPVQSKLLNRILELYEIRKNPNLYIVEVYQVQKKSNTYICQGMDLLEVIIQRIPNKLSHKNNISFNESVIILLDCLKGYKNIYDFNGASHVSAQMIGINLNGKAKVWINSNFVFNSVESKGVSKFENKLNERQMINQIIEVIAKRIKQSQQMQFRRLFNIDYRNFEQAINCICGYLFNQKSRITQYKTNAYQFRSVEKHQPLFETKQLVHPISTINGHNRASSIVSLVSSNHKSKSPQSRYNTATFSKQPVLTFRQTKSPSPQQKIKTSTVTRLSSLNQNNKVPLKIRQSPVIQRLNSLQIPRRQTLLSNEKSIISNDSFRSSQMSIQTTPLINVQPKFNNIQRATSNYEARSNYFNNSPYLKVPSNPITNSKILDTPSKQNTQRISEYSQPQQLYFKTSSSIKNNQQSINKDVNKPVGSIYVDRDISLAKLTSSSNKLSQRSSQARSINFQSKTSAKQQTSLSSNQPSNIKPQSKSNQIQTLLKQHHQQNQQMLQKLKLYNERIHNPQRFSTFNQIMQAQGQSDSVTNSFHQILNLSGIKSSNDQQQTGHMQNIPVITYDQLKYALQQLQIPFSKSPHH